HVFPNCLRSSSIMEGEMDFHAWVGSKIYSWMFFGKYNCQKALEEVYFHERKNYSSTKGIAVIMVWLV
ncbi:hypothetical protein, partial [Geobacillus sp. LEMMJ02]|uniref:hypothetical protein n=1 Tax=Geobacillus sp. LEMMJ02 TaxID=2595057 RepID=UPI001C8F9EC2